MASRSLGGVRHSVLLGRAGGCADIVAIGGLSVFIKGGAFFIPGSFGAQDAGNLLLVTAFGYSEVTGITFALLRRFRELVWIAVGLVCLGGITGKGGDNVQGWIGAFCCPSLLAFLYVIPGVPLFLISLGKSGCLRYRN